MDSATVRTHAKVLVLYEDVITAIRAKSALDQVPGGQESGGDCRMHIWRLDLWCKHAYESHIMQDALAADILVLSIHQNDRLPPGAAARLRHWIGIQRGGLKALVISLDPGARLFSEEHPELADLCFAASRTGLRILLHADEVILPDQANGFLFAAGIAQEPEEQAFGQFEAASLELAAAPGR
jgi:hypothetical protein